MKERWGLDLVPMWVRSLPWLRRYYWQRDEIARAKAKAARLWEMFG